MQVLRAEVWFSIVAALVVTGVMIWLLDKYSPYSAQNNATLYPPNCRYAYEKREREHNNVRFPVTLLVVVQM